MHSSRMRMPESGSGWGGGCAWSRGCLVRGSARGGGWGCLVWGGGGVSGLGGCLLQGGGWCVWSGGGVCLVQGGVWSGGCLLWGGGVSGPGGCVPGPGGVCSGGEVVCLVQGGVCSGGVGGCLPRCLVRYHHPPPPPCEQNDKQVQKYYLGHNFVAAGNKGYNLMAIIQVYPMQKLDLICWNANLNQELG